MTWKTFARMGSIISTVLAAAVVTAVPAAASGDYIGGAGGQDISWPQCGRSDIGYPADNFTVVGVNGGEPYTMNPCFTEEFSGMLSTHAGAPSVYINLQYGESADGFSDCAPDNHACQAYDYGYMAALYSYTQANFQTRGASLKTGTWWLDVETMNDWNGDPGLNDQVIRGAIDYLRTTGHRIGVYSTPDQWSQIAGGYNPGPSIGNWVAGAAGLDDYGMCFQPLWPGAPVWLFQYLNFDIDLDQDHSC